MHLHLSNYKSVEYKIILNWNHQVSFIRRLNFFRIAPSQRSYFVFCKMFMFTSVLVLYEFYTFINEIFTQFQYVWLHYLPYLYICTPECLKGVYMGSLCGWLISSQTFWCRLLLVCLVLKMQWNIVCMITMKCRCVWQELSLLVQSAVMWPWIGIDGLNEGVQLLLVMLLYLDQLKVRSHEIFWCHRFCTELGIEDSYTCPLFLAL